MLKATNHSIVEFEKGSADEEEYVFVHGADPQLGFIDEAAGGDGTKWDKDLALLERAIKAVNMMKPKPKFFFINGDLVHAMPGDGKHKQAQEQDLLKILNDSTVPILVSCGNHDIGNEPTTETMHDYNLLFGDDYYSFCVGKLLFIVLNSQYFFDPTAMKRQADEQMDWLRKQLKSAKYGNYSRSVVFMHIPLFTATPDEDDGYINLPTIIRRSLLDEFAEAGVEYVFSGHYHRNAGGIWQKHQPTEGQNDETKKIEVVVSSAIGMQLGNDQSGLSIVKVTKTRLSHQYFSLEDIPVNVE